MINYITFVFIVFICPFYVVCDKNFRTAVVITACIFRLIPDGVIFYVMSCCLFLYKCRKTRSDQYSNSDHTPELVLYSFAGDEALFSFFTNNY